MGRAKKNTVQLTMRINFDLIDKLKSINPAIVTKDTASGDTKFRHGALGKYVERLIQEDIDRREARKNDEILERFS